MPKLGSGAFEPTNSRFLISREAELEHDIDALVRSKNPFLDRETVIENLVRNCGYIDVHRYANGLHVRCRPGWVTSKSLGALKADLLDEDRNPRIVLSTHFGRWSTQFLRNTNRTRTLIDAVIGCSGGEVIGMSERFLNRGIAANRSRLRAPAETVRRQISAGLSPEAMQRMLNDAFQGRWTLSSISDADGQVVIHNMGDGFTPYHSNWHRSAPGVSLAMCCGDAAYADWVAGTRRHVLDSDRTEFDEVDVYASFENSNPVRIRYERVTMPVTLGHGSRLIFSASVGNAAIDLRKSA
ncbi:MAG: hypothetical protein R3D33_01975 [Hyphomicrobiaceae bacterium]